MTATRAREEHKLLNFSEWSFDNLIEQLPASFPANWGRYRDYTFEERDETSLPLTLLQEGRLLYVQITDDHWIADLAATCHSIWDKETPNYRKPLRLDRMVYLIYHWVNRTNSVSKKNLLRAWKDMQAAILLWAIQLRSENNMKRYLGLYPFAYLGEVLTIKGLTIKGLTIKDTTIKDASGHLCNWITYEADDWYCKITIKGGERIGFLFAWTQLVERPELISLAGKMSGLHQDLLQALPDFA